MAGKHAKRARTKPTAARPGRAKKKKVRPQPAPRPPAEGELLDMNQAIAMLKTTRPTFYRWLRSGKIKGMKVGRQWRFYREDVDRFLKGQQPRIELPTDIGPLVATLSERLRQLGGKDSSPADVEPVPHAVNLIIMIGVTMSASDVSIEPFEDGAHVRYRVDGVLHTAARFDLRLLPAIVEQLKSMAACDVRQKRLPQDGRILLSLPEPDGEVDLRVSFLPAVLGESVTLRVLKRLELQISLDRIGYAQRDRERLMRALHAPWGLTVVSGPTGSGKTTVLYSALMHLVSPERKILSIEDPVEYLLGGVTQIQIMEKEGMTFERALRGCLRSAPNVIMVGEIRNFDALMVSLQAALTGHLVLTTLHTDSAANTLKRMVDIGAQPFVIAEATRLVSAQRLVRLLCEECCAAAEPANHLLARAEELARAGGLDWAALPKSFRKPTGCAKCSQTGYRGRTILAEMLEITPEIGKALRDGAPVEKLQAIGIGQGMTTLAADGVRRAAEGQTTLEEVFSVLGVAEMPRAGWGEPPTGG